VPAQFDPNAYTPARTLLYRATARYFFGTIYAIKHRLEITGRENIPTGTPLVVVANHLSNSDPPLLATATDIPLAFLAKEELYTVPGLKQWIICYGAISVDRDKPEKSTFKAVKNVFAHDWALGMFIEGTRNKNPGVLGKPHTGPAWFAKANKALIVPVGITGTNTKWGKAHARIGKPITPNVDTDITTWDIMQSLSDLTGFALPERSKTIDAL